jgi:hypothetical protein
MVTAIVLMSLVGITLTVMMVAMRGESGRTQQAEDDAQLRQLLLAGSAFAISHAESSGHYSVPLPDGLRSRSAELTVEIQPGQGSDEKIAEIEADLPKHRLSQQIYLSRLDGKWSISQAHLGE